MNSNFVVDVTEADFEYEVIAYSQNVPVVVDFWAEWCHPCKMLGPLLERLAEEAQGQFRLAKVDVDASPNLALRYNVRSIPNVKAFQNGHVVSEFSGVLPEPKVREFLEKVIPQEDNLALERAWGLLHSREFDRAVKAFRELLDDNPENPSALLGLSKTLIYQGEYHESMYILRYFPDGPEYSSAGHLKSLVQALMDPVEKDDAFGEDPLETAFRHSLRLVKMGNINAALDGLLEILRQDKRYRDGEVRLVIVGLLELLGEESEETKAYRRELSSILF